VFVDRRALVRGQQLLSFIELGALFRAPLADQLGEVWVRGQHRGERVLATGTGTHLSVRHRDLCFPRPSSYFSWSRRYGAPALGAERFVGQELWNDKIAPARKRFSTQRRPLLSKRPSMHFCPSRKCHAPCAMRVVSAGLSCS
jgi:hypothetical protein